MSACDPIVISSSSSSSSPSPSPSLRRGSGARRRSPHDEPTNRQRTSHAALRVVGERGIGKRRRPSHATGSEGDAGPGGRVPRRGDVVWGAVRGGDSLSMEDRQRLQQPSQVLNDKIINALGGACEELATHRRLVCLSSFFITRVVQLHQASQRRLDGGRSSSTPGPAASHSLRPRPAGRPGLHDAEYTAGCQRLLKWLTAKLTAREVAVLLGMTVAHRVHSPRGARSDPDGDGSFCPVEDAGEPFRPPKRTAAPQTPRRLVPTRHAGSAGRGARLPAKRGGEAGGGATSPVPSQKAGRSKATNEAAQRRASAEFTEAAGRLRRQVSPVRPSRYVLIPVHDEAAYHWISLVVHLRPRHPQLYVYDSLSSASHRGAPLMNRSAAAAMIHGRQERYARKFLQPLFDLLATLRGSATLGALAGSRAHTITPTNRDGGRSTSLQRATPRAAPASVRREGHHGHPVHRPRRSMSSLPMPAPPVASWSKRPCSLAPQDDVSSRRRPGSADDRVNWPKPTDNGAALTIFAPCCMQWRLSHLVQDNLVDCGVACCCLALHIAATPVEQVEVDLSESWRVYGLRKYRSMALTVLERHFEANVPSATSSA